MLKIVLATDVPGELCSGIVVYDETASDWYNGSDIVFKGAVEVLPS